jgi:tRNA-2-methylthio-N6-dimethylallyladenosine synthase
VAKIFIKTFGCVQNEADSERIKAFYWEKGDTITDDWKEADKVVINSCVIRESAENRVYGLIDKIRTWEKIPRKKIILTGCLVPISKKKIDGVDEMLPIKNISFDIEPLRKNKSAALIPISSGCDNYCSYCIVPYSRGQEISRPMMEILTEINRAINKKFEEVVLIGQNVNSYWPSFPKLLESVAEKNLKKISFISSNPWDFSDELIGVIAKYKNIDRLIHLPFQSGDDEILRRMNRSYTQKEYLNLVAKIKKKIPNVRFSTDIIIGFPGEDETAFQKTVEVCKKVKFEIAYINKYSPRRGTVSAKLYKDDIPMNEKKRRWKILDKLVNQKQL